MFDEENKLCEEKSIHHRATRHRMMDDDGLEEGTCAAGGVLRSSHCRMRDRHAEGYAIGCSTYVVVQKQYENARLCELNKQSDVIA